MVKPCFKQTSVIAYWCVPGSKCRSWSIDWLARVLCYCGQAAGRRGHQRTCSEVNIFRQWRHGRCSWSCRHGASSCDLVSAQVLRSSAGVRLA